MRGPIFVLALIAAAVPAAAATPSGAMAPVRQFVDGFNKGDTTSALAACGPQTSIIDEFPPYHWAGPTACADWAKALDAANRQAGITGGVVQLGTPKHADVSGDRAYVVVPATYSYSERGKPVREAGATMTFALRKYAGGWRITSWAWSKP